MAHPEFITEIETQKVISNELEAKMKEATGAYVDQFLKTQGANLCLDQCKKLSVVLNPLNLLNHP